MRDTRDVLQQHMEAAVEQCDVVITSGGVSMGEADFVKGILQDIGTVGVGCIVLTKMCVFSSLWFS